MSELDGSTTYPLYEERFSVGKRTVETGHVQIAFKSEQVERDVRVDLDSEEVEVERVPIGSFVETAPAIRHEGDVTIYPVVEEVCVVRLLLREEVRVTRGRRTLAFEDTVTLRRQTVTIERHPTRAEQPPISPPHTETTS